LQKFFRWLHIVDKIFLAKSYDVIICYNDWKERKPLLNLANVKSELQSVDETFILSDSNIIYKYFIMPWQNAWSHLMIFIFTFFQKYGRIIFE